MRDSRQFKKQLEDALRSHQPTTGNETAPYAAVLVPLLLQEEPEVLLTVRAHNLNSHPGEVSFPGGMSEASDSNLFGTALRETEEEVGVAPHLFEPLGQLSTVVSKAGHRVYPVVATSEHRLTLVPSPDEIDEIFTVPWHFFASETPELKKISRGQAEFFMPHYYYEDKHIWGLTAMVLLELINLLEGTDWPVPDFSRLVR